MTRFLCLLFAIFFGGFGKSFAQNEDTKIIISDKEEEYTYNLDKGTVQVLTEYTTHYQSLKPGNISFVDFYDNYTEIKSVKIKGIKGVTPKYGMYKKENIFFSDSKACYFELPFIRRDLQATVSVRKIYKDVRRLNFIPLAEPCYIRSKTVKITVPDWMKVDILLENASRNITQDSVRNENNKNTTYIFHIRDQEEVLNEPFSVNYKHIYPYLIVVPKELIANGKKTKYFDMVQDLYLWYREPLLSLNQDEPEVRDKSIELIADCNSDEERIRTLCRWVQQNIRYIAFEDGISAFRPDNAKEVILKKYGDCKGMSNLLKDLLIAAGFDARLAWVATRMDGNKDLDVNAPILFADHMICSLLLNDSLFFIDPTVKSLSFGEIPEQIQGRKALIENGNDHLIATIPEYDIKTNMDSLFIQYSLNSGELTGIGKRCFKGESKHSILYWLNSLKEEDKKSQIESFLKNGETQDSISEIVTQGLDSFLPEICVNYKAVRKSNNTIFSNYVYISPDVCKDYQNTKIDTVHRKTGIQHTSRDYVIRISEFIIPDEYQITQLPQKTEILSDKYSFVLSYKQEGNKIIYRKEISIFDPILEKKDFEQWNSDIDRLRSAYSELIVLEKQSGQPAS